MRVRHPSLVLPLLGALVVLAAVSLVVPRSATTGPAPHPATLKAIERGKVLFTQAWAPRSKSCAACHSRGPNKLTGARMKAFPKFDRFMKGVVSGQQKLNHMITTKSKGTALALGSDDLNALEAYVGSLPSGS